MSYLMTFEGLKKVDYSIPVTGWSPRCPNCGKKRAHYSMLNGWVCSECGLFGIPEEEWIR